jgi:hypothetical protein
MRARTGRRSSCSKDPRGDAAVISLAGAVLALAAVMVMGTGALLALAGDLSPWPVVGRLGLAFGAGLVALSVGLTVGGLAGLGVRGTGIALTMAGAVVSVWRHERWGGWSWTRTPPEAGRWRLLESALLVLIVAQLLATTATALLEPIAEWDVLAIWALKAKAVLAMPLRDSPYFHDVRKAYSHLDYPLLWPFAIAWVWAGTGQTDVVTPKLLGPALLAATAATFYGLSRFHAARRQALLFTAALLAVPMVASQASRLMADAPFALFVLTAAGAVHVSLRDRDAGALRIAGLFAAGLLLTKNEGMAALPAIVLATAVGTARSDERRWRPAAICLVLLPLLLAGPWLLFRAGIPKLHEDYGTRVAPASVLEAVPRLPSVLTAVGPHLVAGADWAWLWPLVALTLLATARTWWRGPAVVLPMAIALLLGAYVCVFLVSPWSPGELAEASAGRLLLHVAPLALLAVSVVTAERGLLPWLRTAETPADVPRPRRRARRAS